MKRREVFPILGAAATVAASSSSTAEAAPLDYKPRALSAKEYATVTKLANMILPADESSAGAGDAGAAFYIDTVLFHAAKPSLAEFRAGLKPLTELKSTKALDRTLAKLDAANDPFFRRLKLLVVDAYCLSPEARKFLHYTGDSAVEGFPGCNHPEHHKV